MASNTTNYGWTKPDYEDDADIMVINDTIDNIDAQVKANDDKSNSALVELVDGGAKNRFLYGDLIGITDNFSDKPFSLPAGEYKIIFVSTASSGVFAIRLKDSEDNSIFYITANNTATTKIYDVTITTDATKITVYSSVSNNFTNFMICTKAEWDISQAFVPYGKTNADLTVLTDEDRDALVEIVDGGAKNKLLIGTPTSVPTGLTCVRNNDGTYTVSGTLSAPNSISFNLNTISGNLVLSGCPEGGGNETYLLRITKSGSQVTGSVDTGNGSDVFTMSGTGYALNIRFAAGTYTDIIFEPMICTKAEWNISQQYVPYRPSYQELYERVVALENA